VTKAATLALTAQLTLGQLAASLFSHYYDDAIYALGGLPYLCDTTLLDVIPGQATFTLPDPSINLLDVWYDNRTIDPMTHAELLALSPRWEDERGFPVAYTSEHMDVRTFRLYPLPMVPSDPLQSATVNPFGPFAPLNHVTVVATAFHSDVPSWLELPIVFLLLAREYARESPHRDPQFAQGCQRVAQLLMDMLILPAVE